MRAVAVAALAVGLFALPPAPAAEPKAGVGDALKKAGEFLRKKYTDDRGIKGKYGLGEAALSGLGMLEAGVKEDDPAVQNVLKLVRAESLIQTDTYHISLAIIFLDRFGDRGDVPLIQVLGIRLYAGMNSGGGWTYKCWSGVDGADALLKSLQTNELTTKDGKDPPKDPKGDGFLKPDAAAATANGLHPVAGKLHVEVSKAIKGAGRTGGTTDDNSNTQFGIVGLWVAARNGVPAKDAFALLEARFTRSQNADGGWGYEGTSSLVSMTGAGLLGLAVGRASREVELTASKPAKDPPKDLPKDDPFYAPKKGDGEKADTLTPPKEGGAARSRAADAGLKYLGGFLAAAHGGRSLRDFCGMGTELYMLWSVERACVAYGMETLGGVDWHAWGVGYLLTMQGADGSFTAGMYPSNVDTTFAILFLAKSNFTRELSSKKGKDPGKGELRGGGGPPPLAQKPKDPKETKPQGGPSVVEPEAPTTGGFTLPKVAEPTEQGEAEKASKGLIEATDADWPTKLAEARDSKGTRWTRGLVLACGRLDGDRRVQARDALADRLTRMTVKTLREMLRDPEHELRRGACLAIGMKDERDLAPALIERLSDPSEYVVRAARAALKSLANGQDFGPSNAADDDARVKAAAQWKAWFDQQGPKK